MNITKKEAFESVKDYIGRVDTLKVNIEGLIDDMGEAKDITCGTEEYEFRQNLNVAMNWLGYVRRALKFAKSMVDD